MKIGYMCVSTHFCLMRMYSSPLRTCWRMRLSCSIWGELPLSMSPGFAFASTIANRRLSRMPLSETKQRSRARRCGRGSLAQARAAGRYDSSSIHGYSRYDLAAWQHGHLVMDPQGKQRACQFSGRGEVAGRRYGGADASGNRRSALYRSSIQQPPLSRHSLSFNSLVQKNTS